MKVLMGQCQLQNFWARTAPVDGVTFDYTVSVSDVSGIFCQGATSMPFSRPLHCLSFSFPLLPYRSCTTFNLSPSIYVTSLPSPEVWRQSP